MNQNTTIFSKFFCLIALLVLMGTQLQAQIDREFWFAPPDLTKGTPSEAANPSSRRDRPVKIVVSTINEAAQVTIWQPANLSFQPIVLNLASTATATADLTSFLDLLETTVPDSVMKTGLLIRSTAPITCYYELGAGANRELISLKGKNANGTFFYTPFQTDYVNARTLNGQSYDPQPRSGFVIIATDDSTEIIVTPRIDILNHLAGVPDTIRLDRGQTYYYEALDHTAANRPAGTKVVSNKPIAITLKDDMIDILPPGVPGGGEGGADLAADQMISEDKSGLKHIVVKGNLTAQSTDFDRVYVIAFYDSTNIFVNGNPVAVATINAGEQYTYRFFTDESAVIEGSKKIQLWHLSGSTDQVAGDVIPSLQCTGSNQIGFTRPANGGTLRMTLTIKTGFENNFVLNGAALDPSFFQPVNGSNGAYVFMRRAFSSSEIPAGSGSLITNFSAELFHMSLTFDLGPSCNYGYFSNFSYLNLGTTRSLCLGDSAVLDAGPGKTVYRWGKLGTPGVIDTTQKIVVSEPGSYYVSVQSGNECGASDTVDVEYYLPPVNINASRDTICEGTQLLLTVPGNYLFTWYDGSTNPFKIVSDSGLYYVEITDYQGCRGRDSIRIYTAPRPITPVATILPFDPSVTADSLCAGESFTAEMSALQGATYSWIGPNNSLYSGIQLAFDVAEANNSGQYLAFYNVDGCESFFDTVTLFVRPSPEVYIGAKDTVCSVSNVLLDAGAGAGYTYLWQDASTNQTFTATQSGIYWVEVSNPEGCSRRDSADLFFSVRPDSPVILFSGASVDTAAGCEGTTLLLNLSAITGANYFWITPSDTIQASGSGFSIEITDESNEGIYYAFYRLNGCKSELDSIDLTVNQNPQFDFAYSDTSLCGGQTVVLDASAAANVTFLWQNSTTNATLAVTTPGEYWVRVTNATACSDADTINVADAGSPANPALTGDKDLCIGEALQLTVSNAGTGVSYVWNGPAGTITTSALNLPQPGPGTYEVFAVINGCFSQDTTSIQVSVNMPPDFDLGADTVACGGKAIEISGPDGYTVYSWSNNDQTQQTTLVSGSNILTVTSFAGCVGSDTIFLSIGSPVAQFTSNPESGALLGAPISFTDQSQGQPISWNWSFGDNQGAASQNTTHAYNAEGTKTVTLIITDQAGCTDTTSRVYEISNQVAVPNSFTPNGDSYNDFFVVKGLSAFPDSKLLIFNRWGSEIFNTADYDNKWDGGGYPDGVYFYVLTLSSGETMKGDLTLIRK